MRDKEFFLFYRYFDLILLKYGFNIPVCNSFGKFVVQKNPIKIFHLVG